MKNNIAILTDFTGYDEAYALNQCVRNIIKMLTRHNYHPLLIVRKGANIHRLQDYDYCTKTIVVDGGRGGNNRVEVDNKCEDEIQHIHDQLRKVLKNINLVFTHDLLMQPNQWKYHVAARRLAKERPDIRWLHTVHSLTNMKQWQAHKELDGKFPNSKLWTYSQPEIMAKRYCYDLSETVTLPAPVDFLEFMHPISQDIARPLMTADFIICYPCRLDRGKRPEKAIKIGIELVNRGYDTKVILINSYSNQGDKKQYREELRELAKVDLILTSDYQGLEIRTPRQIVMDLLQVADILVQPSVTESYSRVTCEAAWSNCLLVLNDKIPIFQDYNALWLSDENLIDKIISQSDNHRFMRQERSLEALWLQLKEEINGRYI
jgi:glycosyltransferase involved in cell wall biosynthesis